MRRVVRIISFTPSRSSSDTSADHRRRDALGLGRGRQAALGSDANEGFNLLELVHWL
jgi:hypothetical protein